MNQKNPYILMAFCIPAVIWGCAPTHPGGGVPWLVQRYRTTDAKVQTVRGMPYLRVNRYLIDRLERSVEDADASAAKEDLQRVLGESHRLATDSISNELDRLPPAALKEAWRRWYADEALPADARRQLKERYLEIVRDGWEELRAEIDREDTLVALQRTARDIVNRVNPSIQDRHGSGLFLQMMMTSIAESNEPLDHGGPNIDLYESAQIGTPGNALIVSPESSPESALLVRYSPIIVQERIPDAAYSTESDRIGTVRLSESSGRINVLVDVAMPSVYGYWQPTQIHGKRHVQLVYCYWYPERPALKPNDPEAGHIDGATLRITLDSEGRPGIFETILNCGCYHRCYVTAAVEAAAKRKFGGPLEGKRMCVERNLTGLPDWSVPETVSVPNSENVSPIIFSRAGYHGPAGISFDEGDLSGRSILDRRGYLLRPYATLERLETSYGFGSMFGPDGLVHYAGRPEGWLLAGTGMISAGQPRQRGTQRIRWDQFDFDDPHLLEKCLRLPSGF